LETLKKALGAFRAGDLALARDLSETILKQDPDNPGALRILGQICYLEGNAEEAAELLEKSLKVKPDQYSIRLKLGNIKADLGDHKGAIGIYSKALDYSQTPGLAFLSRAQSYSALGKDQEAWADLGEAVRVNPTLGQAYRMMILLEHPAIKEAAWEQNLLERLVNGMFQREDAIQVHYALAGFYENAGDQKRMWNNLNKANGLQKNLAPPWTGRFENLVSRSCEVVTAGLLEKTVTGANKSLTPIFIVGMPRSGSTLLEQMLSRHPEIGTAGETSALTRTIGHLQGQMTLLPYPEGLDMLAQDDLKTLTGVYQEALEKAAGANAAKAKSFVTDKLLSNGFFAGFIKLILPWAKVIHIRRDPLDTALSIYKNYFWEQQSPEFCSLKDIGTYARFIEEMMAHWKTLLPGFIHEASYEGLVENPEAEMKKIIDFVGLPWDASCLDHQGSEKRAETLSSAQVRKPLHSTSIGRGKKFEQELAPFMAAFTMEAH
jgi:tetratricopeptide (TPR) repeat protein